MQLIQAIAKSAPRQVNTRYGQKTVIDAVGNSGQEITIWRGGDDRSPALNSITNGSRIAVGLDSKGKYSLIETPADRASAPLRERAAQAASRPISPVVEASPETRPMGFHATSLPMESEKLLRQQIAQARAAQPVAIPQDGYSRIDHQPSPIDARIGELGRIYAQCLAVAGGSELAAIEIFKAAIG
jgi:hypothetical protein